MEWRDRIPPLLALAIPVLAGAAWMAAAGAPTQYPVTNLAALAVLLGWIVIGRAPHTAASRHLLAGILIVLLFYALVSSDPLLSINQHEVRRWIDLGSVSLHSGMLLLPALVVVAARDPKLAAPILLAALLAVSLQPDAASGFAILFAAVGIHHVTRDWKVGITCIIAFFASIAMALRGEVAPQPFVERVFIDAGWMTLLLAPALLASFLLVLFRIPFRREARFALAGAMFGFVVMAMMSTYPMPLVGYGASSIIGFGIALGLHRKEKR